MRKRQFPFSVPCQFSENQMNALDTLTSENGTSLAEIVRRAFDFYLEQNYPQLIVK